MNTEKIKIGITLGLKEPKESIWTNGIKQNVLMLYHLLKNSKKNYDIYILNIFDVDFSVKPNYLSDVKIDFYKNIIMDMDLVICMGGQIEDSILKEFRENKDKRVISYKCGNNYVLTMEEILFKEDTPSHYIETEIDEVWLIPQQEETNIGFYTTSHRADSIVVPFVWHPKFLDGVKKSIDTSFESGTYKKDSNYVVGKKKKNIGIMEPNLNIVKFSLIPSMVVEESYRTDIGKEHINTLYITNSIQLKTNKTFMSYIKTFDLYKDNKVSSESRYQTGYIMSQYLDVLVCHQLLNPLNYLYLDVAYLGYPVLHNAYMCKDLGYYYEGSNTSEGGKVLNHILTEHDNNIDEYNERNKVVLDRYHADNENLILTYDKLINNLWNGGNSKLEYDYKTNLYK